MRELEWREDEEVWGGGACLHLCFGRRWQRGPYIYRKDRRAPHILSLWIKKLGWGWQGFHNKVRKRTWQILLYSIIFSSLSFLLFIFTLCMCVYVAVADWAPKRSSYVFCFLFFLIIKPRVGYWKLIILRRPPVMSSLHPFHILYIWYLNHYFRIDLATAQPNFFALPRGTIYLFVNSPLVSHFG